MSALVFKAMGNFLRLTAEDDPRVADSRQIRPPKFFAGIPYVERGKNSSARLE